MGSKVKLLSDPDHGRSISECPETGWMAIVNTRDWKPNGYKYGYVAYVKDADEDRGVITVVTFDANWTGGKVYRKTGIPSQLKL